MLSDSEKLRILTTNLSAISRDPDAVISEPDFKHGLDEKVVGGHFDDNLFEQLIGQIERRQLPLTVNNFSNIWLEAERRLNATVDKFKTEQANLNRQIDDYNRKKIEVEETERLNAMNIMDGSQLYVMVYDIENIKKANGQPFDAKFVLSCENIMVETPISSGPNFAVNKNYTFPIKLGTQPLEIAMVDPENNDAVEGAVQVPLNTLLSQQTVSMSPNFKGQGGQPLETTIKMDCKWNYSNVKLYDGLIANARTEMKQFEEDKDESERYLRELVAPFPELGRRMMKPTAGGLEKAAAMGPKSVTAAILEEKNWNKLPTTSNPSMTKFLVYSIYFYLLAGMFACLNHCVFLDLVIGLLLFGSNQLNTPLLIQPFAVKCLVGIGVAFLLGIIWMAYYASPWWKEGYVDNFSLLNGRRAAVVGEVILMFARAVLGGALLVGMKTLQPGTDEWAFEGINRPDVF